MDALERIIAGGGRRGEIYRRMRDLRDRHAELFGRLSDHGELTAVVTILHDRREAIEKTRLYEQLKQASDELERKVQAATADIAVQIEQKLVELQIRVSRALAEAFPEGRRS